MSTNWEFVSGPFEGEAFAHRSNGFLTLEFTEEESKMVALDSELVADNGWTGTVEELLLEMEEDGTTVLFDTAANRNATARALENHRFVNDPEVGPMLRAKAAEMRMLAKAAVRDELKGVSCNSD